MASILSQEDPLFRLSRSSSNDLGAFENMNGVELEYQAYLVNLEYKT